MSLLLQSCTACGARSFPPRLLCGTCHGNLFEAVPAETGVVEASTTLHHRAGIELDLDVSLALVRFDDGMRLIVRFEKAVNMGDFVRLTQLPDGSLRGDVA